jgi:methionyl-tRNA formyltransferase
MDGGADSGDILSQVSIEVDEFDDARSLYDKVVATALKQIEDFLPKLQKNNYARRKQDNTQANVWRKRGKADGIIDWRMSAMAIRNLIRGLSKPYAGATFIHKDNEYKVWKAELIENNIQNIEPGKVIGLEKCRPIVKCGVDAIKLIEIESDFSINVGEYL